VTRFVPDLRSYFDRCRLSVHPLRIGAGIKGKLVASMSHGCPSVIGAVAAEGMNVRDGAQVLIADEPQAFARAILRLYADQDLWSALSAAGMDFVKKTYSWSVAAAIASGALEQANLSRRCAKAQ